MIYIYRYNNTVILYNDISILYYKPNHNWLEHTPRLVAIQTKLQDLSLKPAPADNPAAPAERFT